MQENHIKGRFAPTPSGFIHLGNIFCCLLAWLNTKSQGGYIVLRIEDLDSMRCPRSNADRLVQDLEWLGLTWDEGAYVSEEGDSYFQSSRFAIYAEHFQRLVDMGAVYPCFCSRNELHTVNAPHLSDGRVIYPGTCFRLSKEEQRLRSLKRPPAYRLHVPDEEISFVDGNYGPQRFNLAKENGDFIVRRSDGIYAYQLAVTIDDALMGITEVVRGWDLLSSSPLQIYLHGLLGFKPPQYLHIPLLVAPDGRRLAKRDQDMDLEVIRRTYDSPEPLLGYLAFLAGQLQHPEALSALDLLKIYDASKIPTHNITVPAELPRLH